MAGVFIFYLVSYSPVTYGDYQYPAWAEALGLSLSLASMVWVPLYALYFLAREKGGLRQRIVAGLTPVVDLTRDVTKDVTRDEVSGQTNLACQVTDLPSNSEEGTLTKF